MTKETYPEEKSSKGNIEEPVAAKTGSKSGRNSPERTCIQCRKTQNCDEMTRFVIGPENMVVPDIKRKLPGRGVWVCTLREHVDLAVKQKAFARGFKSAVKVQDDLGEILDQMLVKSALSSLSLAKKAGVVVSGFTKVSTVLKSGKAKALLHSSEASEDGIRKVNQALNQGPYGTNEDGSKKIAVFDVFNANELSVALGGENVIHVAILSGGAAKAFIKRVHALVRYRGGSPEVD